ncbi:MAG: methylated-DNA--[protein]-cysteine S-methyltransferase [Methylotenera sp.]|nr:methylated-DNA--[protein]-cysteine S-methyltransferase [Methylotenera sp.]OQW68659.1 MAG: cysteine methyltransferase [Proteobacteria bacterium ST_bin12]PPD18799.1 MAG: cysteine methyltransferase [Methylotenera sp.]PPD56160.1 MAG: cysteine methyltransferase [Methylotenera sp.]
MQTNNKHALQYDAIVVVPFGAVGIAVQGVQVVIELLADKHPAKPAQHKMAEKVVLQIEAYFSNAYNDFNLPIVYKGTPFQRRVWQAVSAIPCGRVLTYGEIAEQIGSGPRAVANACGANHLPLVIPCHRVVAKNGLGGYMRGQVDGLKIKKWLLKHEGISFQKSKPMWPK